jgi:hypothetical protein
MGPMGVLRILSALGIVSTTLLLLLVLDSRLCIANGGIDSLILSHAGSCTAGRGVRVIINSPINVNWTVDWIGASEGSYSGRGYSEFSINATGEVYVRAVGLGYGLCIADPQYSSAYPGDLLNITITCNEPKAVFISVILDPRERLRPGSVSWEVSWTGGAIGYRVGDSLDSWVIWTLKLPLHLRARVTSFNSSLYSSCTITPGNYTINAPDYSVNFVVSCTEGTIGGGGNLAAVIESPGHWVSGLWA